MTETAFLWQKRVLITGANGFIGSHLARRVVTAGANLSLLVRRGTDLSRISDIIDRVTLHEGDLRDVDSLVRCIREAQPQIVFHLAAHRDVSREIDLIAPLLDVNLGGTMNLLRVLAQETGQFECFINTGSSEEYGILKAPFSEDQREKPVSPYSASKVAATYYCEMLCRSFGLPIVTVRPFLTYGPAQGTDMFLPSLITHCLHGRDFPMTLGDQTREFNYVVDVVDAFLLASTRRSAIGEIINIGNGIEYPVIDVARKVLALMGNPINLLVGTLPKRPGEVERFCADTRKIRKLLGWSPAIDLDEGLTKTIEWYRKNFT